MTSDTIPIGEGGTFYGSVYGVQNAPAHHGPVPIATKILPPARVRIGRRHTAHSAAPPPSPAVRPPATRPAPGRPRAA
jgi:hypothetical protein